MRSKPAAIQALVSLFIFQPIIGNLFGPPKNKLAFASTRNSPSSIKDASPQDDLPVVDTPEMRKSVQRIYETWMQRRREDMLAQLKEEMSKNVNQARAFVRLLEAQLGTACLCDADPLICRIYAITC